MSAYDDDNDVDDQDVDDVDEDEVRPKWSGLFGKDLDCNGNDDQDD